MKNFLLSVVIVAAAATLGATAFIGFSCRSNERSNSGTSGIREVLKDKSVLPDNYEALTAAEKEDILYQAMEATIFTKLPALESVSPIKFITAHLNLKLNRVGDEAPAGYEKSIHAHGAAARVKFEAEANSPYTGLFQGVNHGIIRLSVTSDPKGKDFVPGIALKLLIDGQPSRNISALYKLSGQKNNHNFFANELSNIIPIQLDPKSIFSSTIFGRVSLNPTKISVYPLAAIDEKGVAVKAPSAPVQLYFVPNHANDFASADHDFREDLLKIPSGTVIYDVYASPEGGTDISNINYERRAKAVKIGRLVSSSAFIASEFGDRRIFFRHYKFEDNN